MSNRLLNALTHSGPGYELNQDSDWTGFRTNSSRLLDALTHSGPGYSLPSQAEIHETSALKRQKAKDLNTAILEGFEMFFYAQGHLEAIPKTRDVDEKKRQREAAMQCLREFLEHADGSMSLALVAAQESLGPLDLRAKFTLRKLDRLMRRMQASIATLLQALARSGQPKERITHQSQVAVKRATRSLEVLCHAAAR